MMQTVRNCFRGQASGPGSPADSGKCSKDAATDVYGELNVSLNDSIESADDPTAQDACRTPSSGVGDASPNPSKLNLSCLRTCSLKSSTLSMTSSCPYSSATDRGYRDYNEDTCTLLPLLLSLDRPPGGHEMRERSRRSSSEQYQLHYFAVFDGHGGEQASRYCAANLHQFLLQNIKKDLAASSNRPWHSTSPGTLGSPAETVVEHALVDAFIETDKRFCAEFEASYVGTTAVATVLDSEVIWTANCGDSRAVLCRKGVAMALTLDHKATRQDETERVQNAGGHVIWDRVMGELAVSRAIGDQSLQPFVVAEPELVTIERHPQDDFLLLATDGLWDVLNNQEACDLVLPVMQQGWAEGQSLCQAAAKVLIHSALQRGTMDNVSVVLVDMKHF